jgi:hypothetical protein
MKQLVTGAMICMVTAASLLYAADPLFAGSNIFTFPTMVGIKTQPAVQKPVFFKSSNMHPFSKAVTFSWFFPSRSIEKQGMITIYSLQGRVVTKMPIQKNAGTATWNFSQTQHKSGIYIARISYGVTRQNLKLMMWN